MIATTLISALLMVIYMMLAFHPIPDETVGHTVNIVLFVLYGVTMLAAYFQEYRLKDRIKALENKLSDYEVEEE